MPEFWHIGFSVEKQLILAGNADDDNFLWYEVFSKFFRFASTSALFGSNDTTDSSEPSVYEQVLPARRPYSQMETIRRQLKHFQEMVVRTRRDAEDVIRKFATVPAVVEHAREAVKTAQLESNSNAFTIANVVAVSQRARTAIAHLTAAKMAIPPGLAGAGVATGGAVVAEALGPAGVAGGIGSINVPTRQKQKLSRTFNELTLMVMILEKGWKVKEVEFRVKLETAVAVNPDNAAHLLLNLFRHIIPSLTVWFKVLKYSTDPDTVMRMLADMAATCAMVGSTHYELALAQFIAQLQEMRRKAPNLYLVVMTNFHAFNGLFIEDMHADLTRLLQGAHRALSGDVLNAELHVMEHRAEAALFVHRFDTHKPRTTWWLPTAEDARYAPVIQQCTSIISVAVQRACDPTTNMLSAVAISRLRFDENKVERLVTKVAEQDTEAYVARQEENTADLPGDKMVRTQNP